MEKFDSLDRMRRKHTRFRVKDNVIACISLSEQGKPPGIPAKILDISLEGLALCYMSSGVKPSLSGKLEIHDTKSPTPMPITLNCEIIYDIGLPNQFLIGPPLVRRCGVRYVGLSEDQKVHLKSFIKRQQFPEPA